MMKVVLDWMTVDLVATVAVVAMARSNKIGPPMAMVVGVVAQTTGWPGGRVSLYGGSTGGPG